MRFRSYFALTVILLSFLTTTPVSAGDICGDVNYSAGGPSSGFVLFHCYYKTFFDEINNDLGDSFDVAKKWHEDAQLYDFTVKFRDGTEGPDFNFTFISPSDSKFAYKVDRDFLEDWGHWKMAGTQVARTPEMKYGITDVKLKLRNVVPALQTEKNFLSDLDKDAKSTVLPELDMPYLFAYFTFNLHKNDKNQLMWFVHVYSYSYKSWVPGSINWKDHYREICYDFTVSADNLNKPAISQPVRRVVDGEKLNGCRY